MKKISACPAWLGLSEDRQSFVYYEDRAEIVRKIFELSIGGLGSYAIANHLNRQGVPPFPPSPKWDHTTIDSMLRNPATYGQYQPKSYAGGNKKGTPVGEPIPNHYPPAVTLSVFEAAQAARRNNLTVGRGRKGQNITNLFGGLTTCGYCGGAVKFYSNGERKSLVCQKVLQSEGCIRAGWSYRNFERSVFYFLSHPALRGSLEGAKQKILVDFANHVQQLFDGDVYNARFELALTLKQVVSELRLSSAGADPRPTAPDALIRRDNPKRFFSIRIWDGPIYIGMPLEP